MQISPVFFFGPLGLLLLVSHPASAREWITVLVAAGALLLWYQLPADSLSQRTVRASGVCFTAAVTVLTLARVRSLFTRTLVATLVAAAAIVFWFQTLHLAFADLHADVVAQLTRAWQPVWESNPSFAGGSSGEFAAQITSTFDTIGTFYPAIIALIAMLATWFSGYWYHRLALRPLADAPPGVREFRFNDHLIWLLVAAIAGALLQRAVTLHTVAENLLAVMVAVYALRGIAVVRSLVRSPSAVFLVILVIVLPPMLAFAAAGLTLLGVADTWLDFRRRIAPPTGAVS